MNEYEIPIDRLFFIFYFFRNSYKKFYNQLCSSVQIDLIITVIISIFYYMID